MSAPELEWQRPRWWQQYRGVLAAAAVLVALVALVAVVENDSRGTPQMRAVLADPLLDAELPGVGRGARDVTYEGQPWFSMPQYDSVLLTFDLPRGSDEKAFLGRAVALARKHGWPLAMKPLFPDKTSWSCTKQLPGGYRAEMYVGIVEGGPSGFFHNDVEEIDPTRVVFSIDPLAPTAPETESE